MPFAITVANLIEAMKEPGCPICKLERKAARKAIDVFLWENLMDPSSRGKVLDAYGFCPPHTRLMAAVEQSNSGAPVGTNILYENLNKVVLRELQSWPQRQARAGFFRGILSRLGISMAGSRASVLQPRARCPICETAAQSALNTLAALFEEVEKGTLDIQQAYQTSDGVCLAHLRLGLEHLSMKHPKAARKLTELAIERLSRQTELMQEFIRKKNWEYRSEKMTSEEWEAWRKALTFYTGYPGDAFSITIEDL